MLELQYAVRTAWTLEGNGANGCKRWEARLIEQGYDDGAKFLPTLKELEVAAEFDAHSAVEVGETYDLSFFCPALKGACVVKWTNWASEKTRHAKILVIGDPALNS